eukprot:766915-Hanusia_phi.AAC.6
MTRCCFSSSAVAELGFTFFTLGSFVPSTLHEPSQPAAQLQSSPLHLGNERIVGHSLAILVPLDRLHLHRTMSTGRGSSGRCTDSLRACARSFWVIFFAWRAFMRAVLISWLTSIGLSFTSSALFGFGFD